MKHTLLAILTVISLSVSALSQAATVVIDFNSLPQGGIGVGETVAINSFTSLTTDRSAGIGLDMFTGTYTTIGAAGSNVFFTFDTAAVNVTSITLDGNSNNVDVLISTFDLDGAFLDEFRTDRNWTSEVTLSNESPLSYFSVRLLESEISALSFTYTEVTPVPVPGAVWLLGSGLMALFGFARRKRA